MSCFGQHPSPWAPPAGLAAFRAGGWQAEISTGLVFLQPRHGVWWFWEKSTCITTCPCSVTFLCLPGLTLYLTLHNSPSGLGSGNLSPPPPLRFEGNAATTFKQRAAASSSSAGVGHAAGQLTSPGSAASSRAKSKNPTAALTGGGKERCPSGKKKKKKH